MLNLQQTAEKEHVITNSDIQVTQTEIHSMAPNSTSMTRIFFLLHRSHFI